MSLFVGFDYYTPTNTAEEEEGQKLGNGVVVHATQRRYLISVSTTANRNCGHGGLIYVPKANCNVFACPICHDTDITEENTYVGACYFDEADTFHFRPRAKPQIHQDFVCSNQHFFSIKLKQNASSAKRPSTRCAGCRRCRHRRSATYC